MARILLLYNREKWEAQRLSQEIQLWCQDRGLQVVEWDPQRSAALTLDGGFDLALVLGGDGTVLYAAGLLYGLDIPLLGVNVGNLGFITSTVKDRWAQALEAWQEGRYTSSPRLMLEVTIRRGGQEVFQHPCLNEGVIAAQGLAKIVYLEVTLSGVALGEYRADGILVATPTGSTAYSLSAGGPIIHPEADVFVLTPVCPHSLGHRPIVIPSEERVEVAVREGQRTELGLTVDGHTFTELRPGDRVEFVRAPRKLVLVQPENRSFYEVVRDKLK